MNRLSSVADEIGKTGKIIAAPDQRVQSTTVNLQIAIIKPLPANRSSNVSCAGPASSLRDDGVATRSVGNKRPGSQAAAGPRRNENRLDGGQRRKQHLRSQRRAPALRGPWRALSSGLRLNYTSSVQVAPVANSAKTTSSKFGFVIAGSVMPPLSETSSSTMN